MAVSTVTYCLDILSQDPRKRRAVDVFRQRVILDVPAPAIAATLRLPVYRIYKYTYAVRQDIKRLIRELGATDDSIWNSVLERSCAEEPVALRSTSRPTHSGPH